jgi:hypothetical protein
LGPRVVAIYERAVCVHVEDRGDGVTTKLRIETLNFEGADELLEHGDFVIFAGPGEILAYGLEELK